MATMHRRRFATLSLATAAAVVVPGGAAARASMTTRAIPKSGEMIPVIGMGTWQTFDVVRQAAIDQRREVLQAFFDAGGRVLDSSPMYGRSEAVVGKLLPQVRGSGKAFVATKVWTRGKAGGIRGMTASIRKMGGRVDLIQVHNLLDWKDHLATLRRWKAEGKVRYIGVTHYRRRSFDDLERIMTHENIDFVQLPYSIAFRDAEDRLLPCAERSRTAVLVMRPFEGGTLFRKFAKKPLPPWAADFDCTSWAQFFLKFLLGHPAVTCPIPATSKLRHMRDNVRAGLGRLPDAKTRAKMVRHLGL